MISATAYRARREAAELGLLSHWYAVFDDFAEGVNSYECLICYRSCEGRQGFRKAGMLRHVYTCQMKAYEKAYGAGLRVQRSRAKGWKAPVGAVYIGRPSAWQNPQKLPWKKPTPAQRLLAVQYFEMYLRECLQKVPGAKETLVRELDGKTLMCWCAVDQPCHGDAILRLIQEVKAGKI